MLDTKVKGVPKFLTQKIDDHHKDITERACALYLKDRELTPK